MHVADRRHGLDVVAALRPAAMTRPRRARGRAAPRRRQGRDRDLGRGSSTRSARRTGLGPRVRAAGCPACGPRSSGSSTHAETSARLAAAAGCSPRTVELIRWQERRATPSSASGSGSPTRPADVMPRGRWRPRAGPPAVRSGGRRPEGATQVVLDDWEGPLGLLLTLIEARRLDVLTVPLGALAGAYLEALGHPRGRPDQQRQLVRGGGEPADPDQEPGDAAARPTRRPRPVPPTTRASIPEAELRERLLAVPRLPRRRRSRSRPSRSSRIGLFRREPAAALAAALAGAAPGRCARRSTRPLLVDALVRLAAIAAARSRRPRSSAARSPSPSGPRSSGRPCGGAPTIVLQELLAGVRDRVVVAVTFLAMLELMKRREIVVEQASRSGPIMARSHDRRGAARPRASRPISRSAAGRVAGVVRMTTTCDRAGRRRRAAADADGAAETDERPRAGRADRGSPRGAAVRGRAAAVAAGDRGARRRRPRRPSMRGSATWRSRSASAASGCSLDRRSGRAGDGARGGRPHRPLRGRRCRPAVAGRARDARDRRLPPAGHEGRRRADPRRRLGLHDPGPAPSSPRRRARPVRGARAGRSCTAPASTSWSGSG